ncbi:MAG: ABC transporter ATP-binding protein [Promethearchaeota archaeon]
MFFIINFTFKEDKEVLSAYRRSLLVTCLIILGIIIGIRFIFEIFQYWSLFIQWLNMNQLYFAIMVTLYFLLHKKLLKKFGLSSFSNEFNLQYHNFNKVIIIFVGIAWIFAAIFFSIILLNIPVQSIGVFELYMIFWNTDDPPSIFNLSLFWIAVVLFIDVLITILINRSLPDEKRIAKKILRKSMIMSVLITYGIWTIQLIVFEVYMHKWLGIELLIQDIRVLIIIISGLYIIFFFNSLKTKFLPEVGEMSTKKIQKILESEVETKHANAITTELTLENQDSTLDSEIREFRAPEAISFKNYIYLLRKFTKIRYLDEESLTDSVSNRKRRMAIIFWGVTLGILAVIISLTLIFSDIIFQVFFLSYICALFLVVGDIGLMFLFNRINPINKRAPTNLIQNSILYGGLITFWTWIIPFFVIYMYLFIWINEAFILNITYVSFLSILVFYLGIRILRWYGVAVKMWGTPKRRAININLVWLIINLPLRIFYIFYYSGVFRIDENVPFRLIYLFYLGEIIITAINIIVGTILVARSYKRKLKDSLTFTFAVQIIILVLILGLTQILGFFQSLITSYHFNLQDARIPLIVATGIYVITVFTSLRIKVLPQSSEKIKDKFKTILQPTEEDQVQVMGIGNNVILDVKDLTTYFYTEEGIVKAVEDVSFKIYQGETLGLVGETGCGKSVTALSVLRLVRPPGEIKGGEVIFDGEELHTKTEQEFLKYRGNKITMIFQDPLNSLNPVFKIGDQISEVYRLHMEDELLIEAAKKNTSIYDIARKWSQRLLKDLNIPTPRVIFDRFPHELSGGMRQRVQIAMALACSPKLLIADEPTTALDVTVQNQILKLMKELKKKYNTSILFITHDLGIISKMCDRVAVMYSGVIVEYGDIMKLFRTPYHPYTKGLIASVPVVGKKRERLEIIPGMVPNLIYPPSGCRFHPRCQYCFEPCDSKIPKKIEIEPNYFVACHLYDPEYKKLAQASIKKVEEVLIE